MGQKENKRSLSVADLIARLFAATLCIWFCTQVYFISVTGKEGQGKKDDFAANRQEEQILIKDMADALSADAASGVNGAGVLEARKGLLDYYLRINDAVKAEVEGRHRRDDAMNSRSISFEDKVKALSEVAAAMRDIGRFALSEEIYTYLVKELKARVEGRDGTDSDRMKLASQLNNLGVTYYLWSQTISEPKARREKFALAKKQTALCKEVLLASKTTEHNRLEKENLFSTAQSNEKVYETEISFGGP